MARPSARASAAAPSESAPIVPDLTGDGAAFFNRKVEPFTFTPEDLDGEFEPIDYSKVDRGDLLEPVEVAATEEPAVAEADEAPEAAPVAEETKTEAPSATPDAPITIPKARFDEVNEQRKALARRLEELEARLNAPAAPAAPAAPEAFDFDAAERKFLEATLDGDLDGATALRKEINEKLIAQAVHSALQHAPKVNDAVEAVRAQSAVEAATLEMSQAYPVFDPDSESYNDELTKEAVFQTQAMIQMKGMSYPEAVRIAATNVAKLNGIEPIGAPVAKPAGKAPAAAKATTVAQKISAAGKQPPASPTAAPASSSEPQFDIDNMSDAEFLALPRAVRARLRGDLG
jgi:hypothetical protein